MRLWPVWLFVLFLACRPAAASGGSVATAEDLLDPDADVALAGEDTATADAETAAPDAAPDTAPDAGPAADVTDATAGVDAQTAPLRILFLGNSYTYVNDLPEMTRKFAQAAGVTLQTVAVTQGGATLQVLIDQTAALATVQQGGWSHVVLQGQSLEPAMAQAGFLQAAGVLATAAKATGAQVALYQTWPRKAGDAVYQEAWSGGSVQALGKKLHDGYALAAQKTGGVRVAVGDAWLSVLVAHPEIELYQPDGSHPLASGTYLAACVFAATLAHVAPAQVSWQPAGVDAPTGALLRAACQKAVSAGP